MREGAPNLGLFWVWTLRTKEGRGGPGGVRKWLLMAQSQAGPPVRPSGAVQVVHRPVTLSSTPLAGGSARRTTFDQHPQNCKPAHGMRHERFPERNGPSSASHAGCPASTQRLPQLTRFCLLSRTQEATRQGAPAFPLFTTLRALDWAP